MGITKIQYQWALPSFAAAKTAAKSRQTHNFIPKYPVFQSYQSIKTLKMKHQQVYILKLTSGKYYVGISNDPWRRWLQHCKGTGALICRQDPPIARIWQASINTAAEFIAKLFEDYITVSWMISVDPSKVIGGSYTNKLYRSATKTWCYHELNRIQAIIDGEAYRKSDLLKIKDIPISPYSL